MAAPADINVRGAGDDKEKSRRRKALNRNGIHSPKKVAPPSCSRGISQLNRLLQVSLISDNLRPICLKPVHL